MDFDFQTYISQPTEEKAPPPSFDRDFDLHHDNFPPEPGAEPHQAPIIQHPTAKQPDPSFSAEMAVSSLDALQYVFFLLAHKRKLKRLHFASEEDFTRAQEYSRKMPSEIESLENPDEARILISRYNFYLKKLEAKTGNISFTPEEEMLLKKPLQKMIERNPNLDIPPGMALILAGLIIASPRIIDLTTD